MASVRLVQVAGRNYRTYEPQDRKETSSGDNIQEIFTETISDAIAPSQTAFKAVGLSERLAGDSPTSIRHMTIQNALRSSTTLGCVLNPCPAINEKDQEKVRLAGTSRRNTEKTCGQRPTHFISIPLNLNGSLNRSYSAFKSEALETASGLHESAFMPNAKLHLTVTVVNLPVVSDKNAVMEILFHRLGGIKALNVSLLGLDVIKGTVKECSVLYARVAEPKALDSLFKPILEEMAERGLTGDLSIKWHCTLINIKYAEPTVRRCFNATHLIERWKEREFGLIVCDQVHLSILNKDIDKDGYYRAEKKFHLVS